jgi:VWFA-related protein
MKRIGFAAILLALAVPLLAQDPKFGEKIEVNVVLLDSIVTDRHGSQVLGLGKDDFVVKEGGEPQTIDSVDYFTNRQLLTAPEEKAAFQVERVREGRYFILFFDKPSEGQLWDRLSLARTAAKRLVDEQLKPGDTVAVVAHDIRLKVYSDFTSDKHQLNRAIDQIAGWGLGLKDAPAGTDPSILRNLKASTMINQTGTVYEAITQLSDSLRHIQARKNLILFSAGIREIGEISRGDVLLNESRYYEPMVEALNTANVAVYPMNLFEDSTDAPIIHQTLDRMASDTSGRYYRHVVNFISPLKEVEQRNSGYYLLTYHSHHPAGTSGYQKVAVSVKNPEFRVLSRGGYSYGE